MAKKKQRTRAAERAEVFHRIQFDFDTGMMIESPCRACPSQKDMPGCREKCDVLLNVQEVLTHSVPTSSQTCTSDHLYGFQREAVTRKRPAATLL